LEVVLGFDRFLTWESLDLWLGSQFRLRPWPGSRFSLWPLTWKST